MKKIIRNIIAAFLGLIIVILGYFVIANIVATKNNTIASFFGYSITYVPTESMEPTIKTNSTIMFEKNTKYDDLKVGDIIVYHNDETNMYIIHRIKEQTNNGFIMQGDNNPIPDYYKNSGSYYYVTKDNYIGKYITTVTAFSINSTFARTTIFIISVFIFITICATEIVSIAKNIKKDDKKEELISDIDKEKLKQEVLEELKKELDNKE